MENFKSKVVKYQKGFTLVELLIVFALVTVIGITSVPFYSNFFTQNAAGNTYDQLINHFRKAQTNAMIGKQNSPWGVHNQAGSVILFQGSTYASRNPAFDQKLTLNSNISVTGFTDIIFSKMAGTPNAAAAITITGNNTTKTITVNAQGIVNPASAPISLPTLTPIPGKVGWWKLDDGNPSLTAADSSGNANTGTLPNGPTWTTGKIGQALYFDGNNDYVNIGDPANGSLDFGMGSFSYGMWIYNTRNVSFESSWFKGGQGVSQVGYLIEGDAGDLYAQLSDGTTSKRAGFVPSRPPLDKWVHIFAVVDRSTNKLKFYRDGVLLTQTDIIGFGSVSSAQPARIGSNYNEINSFKGKLDDVRVYNRALSATEIQAIYNGAP